MRILWISLFFTLLCAPETHAAGAIARGHINGQYGYFSTSDEPTLAEANRAILQACGESSFDCEIILNFAESCVGIAKSPDGRYFAGRNATSASDAYSAAVKACLATGQPCSFVNSLCDGHPPAVSPPAQQRIEPPQFTPAQTMVPPPNLAQVPPAKSFASLVMGASVDGAVVALASAIEALLAVWIFVSLFSSTPTPTLKRRVALALWIGSPTAIIFLLRFATSVPLWERIASFPSALAFVWTDVFAALCISVTIRRQLSPRTPNPLSLPLVALLVALILAVGLLFWDANANSLPDSGLLVAGEAWLIVIVGALFLPKGSNLVVGYERAKLRLGMGGWPITQSLLDPDEIEDAQPSGEARPREVDLEKEAIKSALKRPRQDFEL